LSNIVFDTTAESCDPFSFGPHAVACPIFNLVGAGFMNAAASNYQLAPGSIGKNAGTDGKDVGADIDALNAAVVGVTGP
jgi:hypothetical protein